MGQFQSALEIFRFMVAKKIDIHEQCYTSLFKLFTKAKQFQKVIQLHEQMKNKKIQTNTIHCVALLESYYHSKRFSEILQLMKTESKFFFVCSVTLKHTNKSR